MKLETLKRKITEHPSAIGIIANSFMRHYFRIGPTGNIDIAKLSKYIPRTGKGAYITPPGYKRDIVDVNGLQVEVYKKNDYSGKKLIFYLHGGAHVMPLISVYRFMSKKFSKAGGDCDVCMINYGVAPEHPFPDALVDAQKGWDYVLSMGYKEEDIIIMGDSAGGNLTLSLMLKLRDDGRKMPCTAICISPWADMSLRGASYEFNYELDPMFGGIIEGRTTKEREAFIEEKIVEFQDCSIFTFCLGQDRTNPYISPVYGDYHGFPPMLITVGGYELLRSDAETITKKLRKEGIEVTLFVANGMFHCFPLAGNMMPESAAAQNLIFDHIRKHFMIE